MLNEEQKQKEEKLEIYIPNGPRLGNNRYHGVWQSIDHVFVSPVLLDHVEQAYINDLPFLLEEDKKYGGAKPLRTYNGMRYQKGFSDHLPLVVRLRF